MDIRFLSIFTVLLVAISWVILIIGNPALLQAGSFVKNFSKR